MHIADIFKRFFMQPLFWLIAYGALVVYGGYALLHIPVEVLPQFNFPQISVITHQFGATASELEMLVARPLEDRILALPNLVSVRSNMGHGTVETDIRFVQGTDPQQDLQSVNSAIDRARRRLSASVHPYPEIMGNAINEVADFTVHIPISVAPMDVQRAIRTRVAPALRSLPGVQRVEVYGSGDESLWIQPDLEAMRHYQVSITSIVSAIRQQVLLGSGGYLTAGHQDILIEARNLPKRIGELSEIPVVASKEKIPLRALARIVRAPVPAHNAVSLDGQPSIALTVFKQPGASTLPVTHAVAQTLQRTLDQLPSGVHWIRTYSQGHLVHLIASDLGRNLLIGAGLAIGVLFWILGAGRGIWILTLSIPLSLLLCIAGLYALGQSLNLMTFGALSVAVGLLADDAIIVLESIYRRWEKGAAHWEGIRVGLFDIVGPDITGTLTTVFVFLPLLFIGGLAGLFFIPFALAMAIALLASLFVSLSLIPLGLGFINAHVRTTPTVAGRVLDHMCRLNRHLFDRMVRFPRLSLTICIVLFIISLAGLVIVPVNFIPLPNEGVMLESFTLAPGSSLSDTLTAVRSIVRRLRDDPAVAHTFARIGSPAGSAYTEPAFAGEIQIALKPDIAVNSLDRIGERLLFESRTRGVQFSMGTPTLERVGESLSGLPQPFVIRLFGSRIEMLRTLSDKMVTRLRRVPALTDIFNNDAYPVTQLQIRFKPLALAAYGLTPSDVYAQIRPLLAGEVVADVPDGNAPLILYVRMADASEKSLRSIAELPIRTQGWTPLGRLATLMLVSTPNQIRHINGVRALEILATPTGTLGHTIIAARRALGDFYLPPGYRISFGGLFPEIENAAISLGIAAIAAFLLMLGILILQFGNLLVPGLLLLQIPLAFTGGAAALIISGVGLNATGLVAFLALVGICLNHGIVLLFYARRSEAAGASPEDAVKEAIRVRFRPIVLTTITAILGMLPTALGWGQGAAPEQGLAVVIGGGILWSALLSTNLIPALYIHWRK